MQIPIRKFLDSLVNEGALTQEQSGKIEIDALKNNIPIDEYILTHTSCDRATVLKKKAEILNLPWVDINVLPVSPQALKLVPESLSRKYNLIPYEVDENNNTLKIAMENPFDVEAVEFLEKKTEKKIIPALALGEDVRKAIDTFYTRGLSPEILAALKEVEPAQVKTTTKENMTDLIKDAPIARIVSTILEYAIRGRSSDIHIEPQENRVRVRYRIDGILQEKLTLPRGINDSLVSRIKILSGLKIDEKRIPQDGRFNFKIGQEEVDLRVSTLPTVHGEKVVMRLLKKTGGIPSLGELGLRGPQLKLLEEAISKPYGIILVTGPTGSGKSTTLYSVLSRLNKPGVNILTLEDPVEYQLAGVNQVQINPQAGLTFATGLRSFLRQDPNVILVGEIRDKETTQLAIQAALTGHLVFATLHTNDAATAIPRLIDLGGEPFLIASVLNSAVAQRIVRRVCDYCKTEYDAPAEIIHNIKEVLGNLFPTKFMTNNPVKIYKGQGCSECGQSGYLGRIAIFEIIPVTTSMNRLILQNTTAKEIKKKAVEENMMTMKQDGYLKALEGITTIEEVLRVAEI